MPDSPKRQRRLVRYPELKPTYGIPWSRMHCDREEKAGRFARKVHLGPNTIAYWSDEIEDMLAARDAAPPPPPPPHLPKAWAALAEKRVAKRNKTKPPRDPHERPRSRRRAAERQGAEAR
jgi:prophage regulatory protein